MDAVTRTVISNHKAIVSATTQGEKRLAAAWLSLGGRYQLPSWGEAYVENPDRYRAPLRDAVKNALAEFEEEVFDVGQETYSVGEEKHRDWLLVLGALLGATALDGWAVQSRELLAELRLYTRAYVPSFLATLPARPTKATVSAWLGKPLLQNATAYRTILMQGLRSQTRRAYKNIPGIRGYKRLAAKSPRTCAACLALDGKIYKLDILMEEHPNGRCQMVPVTDAYNPTWESGREWFATQPTDVQRSILGPSLFNLWKAGRLSWEEIPVVHYTDGHPPSVGTVRVRDVRDRLDIIH